MTVRDDDFTTREDPVRLYYAPGVFLDAEDLAAEQTYHRGRLARVLNYLHGDGTVAGLSVTWDEDTDRILVSAGLAVDRVGRLIEVSRQACMDLAAWFDHERAKLLAPDEHDDESRLTISISEDDGFVVADVFVRFVVCERGRTPAFAFGPFDAIDATAPHRLRDAYELTIELRGADALVPASSWPERSDGEDFDTWKRRMQQAVLDAWEHGSDAWDEGKLKPDGSTDGVDDSTAVFLARIMIPVTVSPERVPTRVVAPADDDDSTAHHVIIDNHSRRFVYSSGALVAWAQALQGASHLP